ncbi:hypothetical protein JCM33374_g1709 [Metschnikowia sp. JCM 33374]|nr:hypothetical protein JCM33374_g1709 [Metschnikowia sp. JCM 33374]
MTLSNSDGRLSKRGKLASYFSGSTPSHHQNEHHSLDNENGDYKAMHESILQERRTSKSQRSQIQMLNVANSRLLQLPTEVLLQIFKHLDKNDLFSLLTVCRDFANLIVEILWFRPNMQSDAAFSKIKEIMKLPRTQTHWDYRNYIKRLNLSFMTKFVDDDLLNLFTGCPKLERLTLVNCTKLTYQPITRVLENCNRLQSIDMTGVQDIQDDIIYALAKNCNRLQGLYAPGCGNISEEAIIQLLHACPMLKRIKFNNSENISDESILAMYENCKSLVEIDLHNCPNVTDLYLKRIFAELTQLREFRISNAAGITDDLFELVPDDCFLDKLRIVDVTGCNAITDKLVERMVKCAPRLRNVVLSKCMQIGDASLRHLTKLGRSLHYIHLGHCASVTDFGVQALVRSCHRIQYIDLACCSQLTDWTLIELSALPKLRRIGLVKCNMITDSGIMELIRRRGEQDCLERVHLSYCTNLTIGPIYCLLKSCPRLTHLSLTGISAFLRREITQYCRDPPPDFTENQKSSFCVFSGHGVVQLRNYLAALMEQRAYILEQYGYQSNVTGMAPVGARRITDGATEDPRAVSPNGISPSPPNEGLGNAAFPVRPDANGQVNLNEEEMSTWAQQRGLGDLRRTRPNQQNRVETNESRFNETDAILRQLLTLEQQNRQRLATFQNATRALQPDSVPNGLGIRPLNAPQIFQPPVFIPENVVVEDHEDTEMDTVDLFPRTHEAQNGER